LREPIRTTFDTNTYSVVARPQVNRILINLWPLNRNRLNSIRDRLCWWYLNWCIRRGRIVAVIPEGVLKAEVLPIADRVSALLAIGTAEAANTPRIGQTRLEIIQAAFDAGFRVLRSPRIAWGALYPVAASLHGVSSPIRNKYSNPTFLIFSELQPHKRKSPIHTPGLLDGDAGAWGLCA